MFGSYVAYGGRWVARAPSAVDGRQTGLLVRRENAVSPSLLAVTVRTACSHVVYRALELQWTRELRAFLCSTPAAISSA